MIRSNVAALIKKELASGLNNPAPYLAGILFLVFSWLWFMRIFNFAARDYASFREFFSLFPLLFVLLIPPLTMRLWAEERRSGTVELLLTMPYTTGQLVLGKFFGTYFQFVCIILLTTPTVMILRNLGDFDTGQIFTQYIGVFLMGASYISMGQFISVTCKNQITAALISIGAMLLSSLVFSALAGAAALPSWLNAGLRYLSTTSHFESFARGVVDTRDLVFFLLSSAVFLYLNRAVLLLRKWR